jgi:hypothetical protein
MLRVIVVAAVLAWSAFGAAPSVSAQDATSCTAGQAPRFVFGFADLKAHIGEPMGSPVTCEFSDPNGTGDVHQRTTTGLAFWRKSTNTPTFTNGFEHWAITAVGSVTWTGSSIDPPAQVNAYPAIVTDSFMQGCTRNAPTGEDTCRCALNKIQARFTLAEFLEFGQRLMDENPEDGKLLTSIIVECVLEELQ